MDHKRGRRAPVAACNDHWTPQALSALGVFGLTTDDVISDRAERMARAGTAAAELLATLQARSTGIALISGPSGGGKSTALQALVHRAKREGVRVIQTDQRALQRLAHRRVINAFVPGTPEGPPVETALRALSAAGLADARIAARRVCELSEGEHARLQLALAMHSATTLSDPPRTPALLAIDEFCTGLDDTTAQGVCATLARWVRSPGANERPRQIVCASSRDQVRTWLHADVHLAIDLGGHCTISTGPPSDGPGALHIAQGSLADYTSLASMHYRGGRPATIARVLVARRQECGPVIAVLTVSMPTLNGAWRALAWPDLTPPSHAPDDLRRAAERLNDAAPGGTGVRCISRVIVDPRHRGQGVAGELVTAYLRDPLTPRTEAVAAMGAACPLFVRAGMREWVLPHSQRDQQLLAALAERGLSGTSLVDIARATRRIARSPALVAALARWARASRATRAIAEADVRTLIRTAARSLSVRPRAYTTP
ncbi:MAG: hypothetical protein K2W85_15075 [Phycisphaerales bacterium]|nr:hypothetical protein [Phycisphaerales bacterium]